MASKRIVIAFPLEGPIRAEAIGYSDKSCAFDMKQVETALEGEITTTNKHEYYQVSRQREKHLQK